MCLVCEIGSMSLDLLVLDAPSRTHALVGQFRFLTGVFATRVGMNRGLREHPSDRGRSPLRPDALASAALLVRRGAGSRQWLRPRRSCAPRAGAPADGRFAAGRRAALPYSPV